jgi:hypothetical protein
MSEATQFDMAVALIGRKMGVWFDVYRPVYTAADQFPSTPVKRVKARIDTQALRYLEPAFPGVYAYEIFTDRRVVRVGDILVPVNQNEGFTCTVLQPGTGMKGMVGILTDHTGSFREEVGNVLYTDVKFQWVGPSFPGSGLNDAIEDSFKIPKRKVAMFVRQGIGMNPPLLPGMRLVESDNDEAKAWFISDIVSSTNLTVMSVSDEK